MKKLNERRQALVELGAASRKTLGAEGRTTDFVRWMEHVGISRD